MNSSCTTGWFQSSELENIGVQAAYLRSNEKPADLWRGIKVALTANWHCLRRLRMPCDHPIDRRPVQPRHKPWSSNGQLWLCERPKNCEGEEIFPTCQASGNAQHGECSSSSPPTQSLGKLSGHSQELAALFRNEVRPARLLVITSRAYQVIWRDPQTSFHDDVSLSSRSAWAWLLAELVFARSQSSHCWTHLLLGPPRPSLGATRALPSVLLWLMTHQWWVIYLYISQLSIHRDAHNNINNNIMTHILS